MELLRKIRFEAAEPEKIDALVGLVDHELGYRLYRSIEGAKRTLSEHASTQLSFCEAAVALNDEVSRADFETWIEPEVRRIAKCIDRLLRRSNAVPQDVDAIFMTGGSSFVPAIRRLFQRKFPSRTRIRAGREFTSVAEGLAIHALELAS